VKILEQSQNRYNITAITGIIADIILIIPITAVSNETALIFHMSNEIALIDFHIFIMIFPLFFDERWTIMADDCL